MYFFSIAPQDQKIGYIWVENNKAKLYNNFELIKHTKEEQPSLISKNDFKDVCHREIKNYEVNNTIIEKPVEKLISLEKDLNIIKQEKDSYQKSYIEKSSFSKTLKAYETYLIENKIYYENKSLSTKSILEIEKEISEICNSSLDDGRIKAEKLLKETEDLSEVNYLNSVWLKNVESWLKKYIDLTQNPEIKDNRNTIMKLKQNFERIFEPSLQEVDLDYRLKSSEEKFLTSLKEVESWQKEMLNKKPDLKSKTVFIFEES
jgi:hypothetical protein